MKTITFIVNSLTFKRVLILTFGFVMVIGIIGKIFDVLWSSNCIIPVSNLNDEYAIPSEYDNTARINLKIINDNWLCIEGNKKFKIADSKRDYDYYDTVRIITPDTAFSHNNRISFNFANNRTNDLLYLVSSKSNVKNIYWNQIFYSTVKVQSLNKFSSQPEEFRINNSELVPEKLLVDNDTLLKESISYFNVNIDNLALAECGTNCKIFKSICDKFNLPCRTVMLQGGDALDPGLANRVGYPLHIVCEVYSSRLKKWFVIDPTYGSTYSQQSTPLNAVEISNLVYFGKESEIIQDSVLATRKILVDKDYFRYYENIYFASHLNPNFIVSRIFKYFFNNFQYTYRLYSNQLVSSLNAREYLFLKTFTYFIVAAIFVNLILIILTVRLLKSKRREI